MCHGGERDPVRYAQLGEHVPEMDVHGVRGIYSRLATAPLVSLSAASSDTARPVAVRLSQPPRRPTPDRAGRDGRPGTRELDKKMKYNGKTV
jgi:hypothetical protein